MYSPQMHPHVATQHHGLTLAQLHCLFASSTSSCAKLSVSRRYLTERGHSSIMRKASGAGSTAPASSRPPAGTDGAPLYGTLGESQ